MNTKSSMQFIAKRVRFLRGVYGWTQTQLARKAGIAQKTISNIEHEGGEGRDTLKLKNLEKIARAFGFELWIFLIPDEEFIKNPKIVSELGDLVKLYLLAIPDGKKDIHKIAEIVTKYNT